MRLINVYILNLLKATPCQKKKKKATHSLSLRDALHTSIVKFEFLVDDDHLRER